MAYFQSDRWHLVLVFVLCAVPLVYVALLLGFGRTTPQSDPPELQAQPPTAPETQA